MTNEQASADHLRTTDELMGSAFKQDAGRWQARVLRVGRHMETIWRSDRIHRSERAAQFEANEKARELRVAQGTSPREGQDA